MTLTQVAESSGLNVGYLSQIENDKALPSLEALSAIGGALDVPIAWFLAESSDPPRIVRESERRTWSGQYGGEVQEIDGGESRELRIVHATMPKGMRTGLHSHSGEEHHLLVDGRLRIRQGEHEFEVGPGDYFVWDATVPHDAEVLGAKPATLLIINRRTHGPEFARPGAAPPNVGE